MTSLVLAAMLLAAPAHAACPAGQSATLSVRIYFGQTEEDGKPIATSAWEDFVATTVTPRFPAGFTVYDAMGQWRDLQTHVVGREPSRIIEIDAADTREFRAKVEEIRKTYRARFHQQAVGLLTFPACGTF
jgi:hypothetical protein